MSLKRDQFLGILGIVIFALIMDYGPISFESPQSIHQWRQSDCASIALNYYQNGMDFLHPQTHNFTAKNGQSNGHFTSEVPLLYYSVALLYKISGPNDYVYRMFNTLLTFLGMFYLFKLAHLLFKSPTLSLCVALIVYSSPVLVFYGNNFLSDSTALSLSIMGWFYFVNYSLKPNESKPGLALFLFTLACAFKITAILNLATVSIIILLVQINWISGIQKFKWKKLAIISSPSLILFVGIISWILYAKQQNEINETTYFSTTIFPIWSLSGEEIALVLKSIWENWIFDYASPATWLLLGFSLIIVIKNQKLVPKWAKISILILLLWVTTFLLLQFWTLKDHDYYIINLFILPIALVLMGLWTLLKSHSSPSIRRIVIGVMSVLLVFNLAYGRNHLENRYKNNELNSFQFNEGWYSLRPTLDSLGIHFKNKVVSIPDQSHSSLYLMNQWGWTQYTDFHYNSGKKTRYNQDSLGLSLSVKNGAQYLIINGAEIINSNTWLTDYTTHLMATHQKVLIFDLTHPVPNFSISSQQPVQEYFCHGDSIENEFFIGKNQNFSGTENQTNTVSHSGEFSCKINESSPYTFTSEIMASPGTKFVITIWQKRTADQSASIVVSGPDFYLAGSNVIERDEDHWEKLELSCIIPSSYLSDTIKIYAYNPGLSAVFVDDISIQQFAEINKSVREYLKEN